jgi:hypothetical protein
MNTIPNEMIEKILDYWEIDKNKVQFNNVVKELTSSIAKTHIVQQDRIPYNLMTSLHPNIMSDAIIDKSLRCFSIRHPSGTFLEYESYILKPWNHTCLDCLENRKIWKRNVDPIQPLQYCYLCR